MGARPRYIVTSIRVAAGSFVTATAVATVVVMGSAPASAATVSLPSAQTPARAIGAVGAAPLLSRETANGLGRDGSNSDGVSGAGDVSAEADLLVGAGPVSRLDGIRREMDQAVQMRMVTADQADRFVNQIQERILRGL
ncbi:hypothetical protein E4J89_18250 [Arthrobacter sp. CAU 1506]|uniref:hypothetical protein n=1 Tax=Arthrobacter sp. CAU 1506 TaxID=2560052 RepID=UPI0010AC9296|nr:hypothetical protein [Arthrobacter sp. CAU 1506]TJY64643.1 hypothetical protein E4J89_18250 [Arthrobacter sp. CAU 1506]